MIRSILVGVDGSPCSEAALDLGISWAKQFDALLVGLGVIDEPTICRPEMVPVGAAYYKVQADERRLAQARARVDQFLEQFTMRCTVAGVPSKLLEDEGAPAETILTEAQRYDLILLGQKTHFRFATQDEPDDTLTQILKNTPRPIVTVPEKPAKGTDVLIAYDGSLQAARVLQAFQASGLGQTGKVHVVSVGQDHIEAIRHAERALEFLGFHNIRANRHIVSPIPSTADAILHQCRLLNAGLLVMGCYGQGVLREFFLGSVTRTILKNSTVPLFLYH